MRRTFSRRLVPCAAIVLVSFLMMASGCGGDGDGKGREVSPALAAALSYLPRDAAIVGVVSTDLDRAPLERLEKRASKLEGWRGLKEELEQQVADGLDFDRDVRPQLGNPLAVAGSSLDRNDDQELSALEVKNPRAMRRLLERSVARGQEERLSDYKGALVIRDLKTGSGEKDETGNTFTALHRNVAVQAGSVARLEAAIDRSAGSDNLAGNEEIATELDRGGEDVLFRVTGDTGTLLEKTSGKDAAAARKVKWVRALGDFSAVGFVTADGVRYEFEQKTDREALSEDDLPMASGPDAALLHDQKAPIAVGLREPDRLYGFVEDALEATDPRQFAEYESAIRQLGALGTDIHRDVLQKITNLSLALATEQAGTFQTDLAEGAGQDLRRFLDVSAPFLEGALGGSDTGRVQIVTKGRGEAKVWTVRQPSGDPLLTYAVRGDALVGSIGTVPLARPVEGTQLPGADGALAVALSGKSFAALVRDIDQQGAPDLGGASGRRALRLLGALGGVRLSLRAETSALTGRGEVVLPRAR